MERMIRKQIYIEARQDEALKRMAREAGISEAEIIRAGLDRLFQGGRQGEIRDASVAYLVGDPKKERAVDELIEAAIGGGRSASAGTTREDKAAWRDEVAFMEARSTVASTGGKRTWKRDALYDERL